MGKTSDSCESAEYEIGPVIPSYSTPTSTTNKELCPETTDQAGRINGQTGLNVVEPVREYDNMCPWCKREFKQVKKHLWRCKLRPVETDTEPLGRTGDRNIISEQGTGQVNNHSATKGPASSEDHFQFKDKEPLQPKIDVTKKLKLPPASDKGKWKGIDEDLVMLTFSMDEPDDEKRLEMTEKLIYSYLEADYGEEPNKKPRKKPEKENSETKAIRVSKREARKEVKQAKKEKNQNGIAAAKKHYLQLVRLHNKSRRNELRKKKTKENSKEQEQFKKNPFNFSTKLLNGDQNNKQPTFSKEDADKFFKNEYCDRERGSVYERLKGLPDVPDPKKDFDMENLDWKLFKEKLQSRRNKSSPGPNGVPYTIYKRCPRVTWIVFRILCSLWKNKKVPLQWRVGEAILIPKTEDLSNPSLFRNITKTNTSGKLNMGLLADKMLDYMTENSYIDKTVQKGFMKKTPGCLEHTQALMEELKDAKSNRRQIYVVWVDLMNAYGRVPHNLILFALRYYKFPEWLISYMISYYDELIVRVVTKEWKTDWFFYLIGLFQGDPLSVVLFLIVFNLLLDLLKNQNDLGYKPSFSASSTSNRAFADDLTLMSSRLDKVKKQIEVMENFLNWSRKMKAKPSKCVSLAMKVIDGTYSSFDPEIYIDGSVIKYIGDTPMKFLGHWIYVDLGLKNTKQLIEDKLKGMFQTVDECGLNGVQKCWIYNSLLTSKLNWELIIYNLPVSFLKELESICTRYLKKWLGVTKSITVSALYRRKDHFGLGLKRLSDLHKSLQVSKGYALKNSDDPKVREIFEHKQKSQENSSRWNYTTELTARERDLYFKELVGVISNDRMGLGCTPKRSTKDNLKDLVASISEQELILTLVDKGVQGRFLTWENTMQLDLGWNNLIYNYKMSPALLKFHLNSMHDVANTPANMKLWNYADTGKCTLCGWKICNIKHILAVCHYSLNNKRFNWRHDNVLRIIVAALSDQLKMYNALETKTDKDWVHFRSSESSYKRPSYKIKRESSFDAATDWRILWDEDLFPGEFPQNIYNTPERPDIVVWSETSKEVILIELTVGDESNFSDQVVRKEARYNRELMPGIIASGWKARLFTIEVGCRGFWHHTVPALFNYFGLARRKKKQALQEAALVALRCSYTIWLARNNRKWSPSYYIATRPSDQSSTE